MIALRDFPREFYSFSLVSGVNLHTEMITRLPSPEDRMQNGKYRDLSYAGAKTQPPEKCCKNLFYVFCFGSSLSFFHTHTMLKCFHVDGQLVSFSRIMSRASQFTEIPVLQAFESDPVKRPHAKSNAAESGLGGSCSAFCRYQV